MHQRTLTDAEHQRKLLQDKFGTTERDLDQCIAENLRLKSVNFQQD